MGESADIVPMSHEEWAEYLKQHPQNNSGDENSNTCEATE